MVQEPIFRFGETVLDLGRGTLRRHGKLVSLRPKTYKLLEHLAENAGRVVSKQELLDAVWPCAAVSDDCLTQSIRDARKCIGDERRAIIRSVSRRGYLFVSVDQLASAPFLSKSSEDVDFDAAADEPRVAILPFRLAGASGVMKPVFDTVVQEIQKALSVSMAFTVCNPPCNTRTSAPAAGVDYLVEGEVEGGNPAFQIIVTLTDTKSGCRLLTQTFSLKANSIRDFHQTVTRQVVSALVFNMETAGCWQGAPQGTTSLHVW